MPDSVPTFKEAFAKVLELAGLAYDGHLSTKRDTWKRKSIQELERMFQKEIEEYGSALSDKAILGEALDVVNFALMIAARRLEFFEHTLNWQARMRGMKE